MSATIIGAHGVLRIKRDLIDVSRGNFREYAPGETTYFLNGEPITKEQADAILDQIRGES